MFALVLQLSGAIALTMHGDCDFTVKAQVAQAGGAKALLVVNNKQGISYSCYSLIN